MQQQDLYAVIGNPISHSKSPVIHTEFAKQMQQNMHYVAIESPLDSFAEVVHDFQKRDGKGLNITVPFKQEAFALVNERSQRAEEAGAVNTLVFREDGTLFGDVTDGVGLVRDLTQNAHYSLTGKRILLLGAGGAVRGVLGALLAEKPQSIMIANRTVEKSQKLVLEFADYGIVRSASFSELSFHTFELVINGTSAGLEDESLALPTNIVSADTFCYDMVYGKLTPFLRWCKEHGARQCLDGLGMLVEQAAESFYIWRGVRPKTEPVIQMLRAKS